MKCMCRKNAKEIPTYKRKGIDERKTGFINIDGDIGEIEFCIV